MHLLENVVFLYEKPARKGGPLRFLNHVHLRGNGDLKRI